MKSLGNQIIILLAIVLCLSNCQNSQSEQEDQTEEAAAATVKTPTASQIPIFDSFSDIEPIFKQNTDTTYVINFWATWCKPCVEELPYFEELHNKYGNEKVKVILVSLDFPKQLESKLYPFVDKHQLKSEVLALIDTDYNSWIDRVDPSWGGAIPVTVIYRKDKRTFIGEQLANFEELDQLVSSFL